MKSQFQWIKRQYLIWTNLVVNWNDAYSTLSRGRRKLWCLGRAGEGYILSRRGILWVKTKYLVPKSFMKTHFQALQALVRMSMQRVCVHQSSHPNHELSTMGYRPLLTSGTNFRLAWNWGSSVVRGDGAVMEWVIVFNWERYDITHYCVWKWRRRVGRVWWRWQAKIVLL
jgi:hypothetical protein